MAVVTAWVLLWPLLPGIKWSFLFSMHMVLAGSFVDSVSAAATSGGNDERCFVSNNSKPSSWPKECNNFTFKFLEHYGPKNTKYEITYTHSARDVKLTRERLASSCSCSCDCEKHCEVILTSSIGFISRDGEGNQMRVLDLSNEDEPPCFRFYAQPINTVQPYNISSCCVRFPAASQDSDDGSPKNPLNATEPRASGEQHQNDGNQVVWVIIGALCAVGCVAVVWLARVLRLKKRTRFPLLPDVRFSAGSSSIESMGTKNFLLIYANQLHNPLKEILEELARGIEAAVKDCKVRDYKKDPKFLELNPLQLNKYIDSFDKVIVLLSLAPPQFPETEGSANVHNKIWDLFSTLYLTGHSSNQKIIFFRLESLPCLELKIWTPSKIYLLPRRLRDFLQQLDFKGDDCVIQQIEHDLCRKVKALQMKTGDPQQVILVSTDKTYWNKCQ